MRHHKPTGQKMQYPGCIFADVSIHKMVYTMSMDGHLGSRLNMIFLSKRPGHQWHHSYISYMHAAYLLHRKQQTLRNNAFLSDHHHPSIFSRKISLGKSPRGVVGQNHFGLLSVGGLFLSRQGCLLRLFPQRQ